MRTYRIEEVTVVTHYQYGMLEVGEILFQPSHCLHIQVIGRLIEQEVVRISVQCLRQHDTHFFLTAQLTHQYIMLIFFHAQSAQQHGCVAFRIPSVQLGKFLFQLGYFQSVFICEIFFRIQFFALLHDVPQHSMPHHHSIHNGIRVPLKVVLAQHRKAFARSERNGTGCRVQISVNRTKEGRFSRTVSTNNTITITTRKLQVYVIKQHSFTKLYRNVRNCNHLLYLLFY